MGLAIGSKADSEDVTMIRLIVFVAVAAVLFVSCLASAQDPAKKIGQDQPPKKDAKPGPQAKLGLGMNDPKAFQGYTLFCPLSSTKAYLIDMTGRVMHAWEGAATPASSAYL